METAKYLVCIGGKSLGVVMPYIDDPSESQFTDVTQMCQHLLDIATDCSPSAQAKLRLMTSILRTNRALWAR